MFTLQTWKRESAQTLRNFQRTSQANVWQMIKYLFWKWLHFLFAQIWPMQWLARSHYWLNTDNLVHASMLAEEGQAKWERSMLYAKLKWKINSCWDKSSKHSWVSQSKHYTLKSRVVPPHRVVHDMIQWRVFARLPQPPSIGSCPVERLTG